MLDYRGIEMENVIFNLQKRRRMMFYIVLSVALIGVAVDKFFQIKATSYFEPEMQLLFVYGLIAYKIIELCILYFLFYHRHMKKCLDTACDQDLSWKFEKNAKRFFMLVPHGSVIFGIISYKLTANLGFFLLFLTIAFTALYLVKPQKFFEKREEEAS